MSEDQAPPPSPPPPGSRAHGGRPERQRPGGGRCTRGGGHRGRGKPPVDPPSHSRITRYRLTTERRHPGRRKRSGRLRGRPGEGGGADQGEEITPPPPPPPPPPPRRCQRPPGNPDGTSIPQRGTPETKDDRSPGHRSPNGQGDEGQRSGPPSPHPPSRSPPGLRAAGAPAFRPPGAVGTSSLPQRGPRRPGAPDRPLPRGLGRRVSPHQRAGAMHGPRLGAARDDKPEQYGGRACHDQSIASDTRNVAHSGRAEGRVGAGARDMLRPGDFVWALHNHRLEQHLRAPDRWLTAAESNCPPRPWLPGREFVASLLIVNSTLDCPQQKKPHPYRDLPGGFSKHLPRTLFPPWIVGSNSMTAWGAHVVSAEWAREWDR